MATVQEKPTLEKRVKNIEDWGDVIAIKLNYHASSTHALEMKVSHLENELEDLKKRFEGSR